MSEAWIVGARGEAADALAVVLTGQGHRVRRIASQDHALALRAEGDPAVLVLLEDIPAVCSRLAATLAAAPGAQAASLDGAVSAGEIVTTGTLAINTATFGVTIAGAPVDFTYMEYELLKFFVTHPDRVFSREALLGRVWGPGYAGGVRTVDVHIRRIRSKLGQGHAERIRTLRSVGYRWDGAAA